MRIGKRPSGDIIQIPRGWRAEVSLWPDGQKLYRFFDSEAEAEEWMRHRLKMEMQEMMAWVRNFRRRRESREEFLSRVEEERDLF